MSSTVQKVQRERDGKRASQSVEAALRKRHRLERVGASLVRRGVCLLLKGFLNAIESRETGLSVGNSYGRMLDELLREQALNRFEKGVRAWFLVDRSHVCDRNICVVFVKFGSRIVCCCATLKHYDRAA